MKKVNTMATFLDNKKLSQIKTEIEKFDSERETIIKQSRDIIKSAKHAIYSVHRKDMKTAKQLIDDAQKNIKKLRNATQHTDAIGAFNASLEEYVEACCFYAFVEKKNIPTHKDLKVNYEQYLLGLCDLTGELGRRAVLEATNKNIKEVQHIKNIIDEIYGFFSQLNLGNSELRKKSDSIKWNLKKVEDLLYDLKK